MIEMPALLQWKLSHQRVPAYNSWTAEAAINSIFFEKCYFSVMSEGFHYHACWWLLLFCFYFEIKCIFLLELYQISTIL